MLILNGLSWCHKFQLHFMSLMPQIKGTFIKIEHFKMKPCPSQKKMTEFVGAISHNTSFRHCPVLKALLDSNESLLVTWVSPPIFGLQQCCRFRKLKQLNMNGLWLNTLFLYYLFHHLYLFFLFFFFNFTSFCTLYFFFLFYFFFYFLLQPMLILTSLSWYHKFQLHFKSLMPQIKGLFIKIEHLKMKSSHLKRR